MRALIHTLVAGVALALSGKALAQQYPTKPAPVVRACGAKID